ncbi:MAG TPA: dihydrofolate reductase family protein [Mycobacteriales bacterium]|nr:dihydrofolate reductase family protein [Mycobacteriales bacterium]
MSESNVRLYMSMSLDGFIAGPDDGPKSPMGTGGERLHSWLEEERGVGTRPTDPVNAQVFDEMMSTGAVICGRHTFENAGGFDGDHHDGVPIFVLTRSVPDEPAPGHARYVSDVAAAVRDAKAAAGDRDVMLHGASATQALLKAGLLDQMELHLVPVLLGGGRRLFDGVPAEFELVRALRPAADEDPDHQVLHLTYRRR